MGNNDFIFYEKPTVRTAYYFTLMKVAVATQALGNNSFDYQKFNLKKIIQTSVDEH